ncbi:MAG: hypothetical protein QF632_06570 [Candidatus Woesearchaeota archaeon]|jgi:hypothetical protein|nr:hypothetical protein [Candidatus Woesearchaeota archaeon]MDP7324399.1 hypothetical protein [Candidatus Woesearchaeota archaeon]MDP7457197.1 hypothetical protein [Candidatus Woesearchaeota archaeon]
MRDQFDRFRDYLAGHRRISLRGIVDKVRDQERKAFARRLYETELLHRPDFTPPQSIWRQAGQVAYSVSMTSFILASIIAVGAAVNQKYSQNPSLQKALGDVVASLSSDDNGQSDPPHKRIVKSDPARERPDEIEIVEIASPYDQGQILIDGKNNLLVYWNGRIRPFRQVTPNKGEGFYALFRRFGTGGDTYGEDDQELLSYIRAANGIEVNPRNRPDTIEKEKVYVIDGRDRSFVPDFDNLKPVISLSKNMRPNSS